MRALGLLLAAAALTLASPADRLPHDCAVAIHVDVEALVKTAFFAKLAEPLRGLFDAGGFLGAGNDVTAKCLGFTAGLVAEDERVFVVFRNAVRREEMEKEALADGEYAATREGDVTILSPKKPGGRRWEAHVALTGDGRALYAGSVADLRKLLAASKPDALPSAACARLEKAPRSILTIAVDMTPGVREAVRALPGLGALASATGATVTVDIGDRIVFDLAMDFPTEAEAKTASAALASKTEAAGAVLAAQVSVDAARAANLALAAPAPPRIRRKPPRRPRAGGPTTTPNSDWRRAAGAAPHGGGGRIRTCEAFAYLFSRQAPSTARPLLRDACNSRVCRRLRQLRTCA